MTMLNPRSNEKVGVYVDAENISQNGGKGMRYDVLREFACRGGATPVRLNSYVTFDNERAKVDHAFRHGQRNFHNTLRDFGYKVIEKYVRWYEDENGRRYGRANADLDLAVDALIHAQYLDSVMLVTGDGDFTKVVRALQNVGCRVEVVAFRNVSNKLRREADRFTSGYLIPNLLATNADRDAPMWGDIGSRVRGVCYHHGSGFGFLRFLREISPDLWRTDSRQDDSPFDSAFFHDGQLPDGVSYLDLPSRSHIFEFTLQPSEKDDDKLAAEDLELVADGVD